MKLVSTLLLLLVCTHALAQDSNAPATTGTEQAPQTIAELVTAVREGSASRRAELERREQRFIEQRDQRAQLLQEATNRREQEEAEADRLRIEDDADYARRAEQLNAYINQVPTQSQE